MAEEGRIGFSFGPRREGGASPLWCAMDDRETEQEEAEAKRLLYVAMTRARDYLFLVGSGVGRGPSWLGWLTEVLPIPEAGERISFSGGETKIVRQAPGSTGTGAPRTLVASYPGIRRGEPVGAPAEVAAAGEHVSTEHTVAAMADGAVLTVSAALALRACPRQYFLRYILGLPNLRNESSGGEAEARLSVPWSMPSSPRQLVTCPRSESGPKGN